MAFHLFVGPPYSGKTAALLELARTHAARDERVWWVGLPNQRNDVYRRLTQEGGLLGVEFLTQQQVYYRLLANAQKLKRLMTGTGRIAMVGQALLNVTQEEMPSPGEARLFTNAIAEAKRYGLGPEDIPIFDEESQRFQRVFYAYEQLREGHDTWDYDDFRLRALALVQAGAADPKTFTPEADLIIVDGLRELGPLEVRLYQTLAQHLQVGAVYLSLVKPPPDMEVTTHFTMRTWPDIQRYRAPNEVSESRWVMRAIKQDLTAGISPLDIAVVLPEVRVRAFLALSSEYGVPVMDETPRALGDTPGGRVLLDLLGLPDYPTASRLLPIPELNTLANAALEQGIAGREALTVLAKTLGLEHPWQSWLANLEAPPEPLEWAKKTIELVPEMLGFTGNERPPGWDVQKRLMLERAKEASFIAKEGAHFRAWWAGLLKETFQFERPLGGVALLTERLVSGRRFKRLYLLHAVEGTYSLHEHEDYFIAEEERVLLPTVFQNLTPHSRKPQLPQRFLGRNQLLHQELLTRADTVIVTYPEASQHGPLTPELALMADGELESLPEVPAGSVLELGQGARFKAHVEPVPLGGVSVNQLAFYSVCAFRYFADARVQDEAPKPWYRELITELRQSKQLNKARLDVLKRTYAPYVGASTWLSEYEALLLRLSYGARFPEGKEPYVFIDAGHRTGQARDVNYSLYTFTEPGTIDSVDAEAFINKRWAEWWAAGYLLERFPDQIRRVELWVWPVLGEPVRAHELSELSKRIRNRQASVQETFEKFISGDVKPQPGFHCRQCKVFDICREGIN